MIFTHPGHGHHVHWPKQIVRIMKLCILIMTTLLLQVSAVTKAQITLSEKNAPFEKVIRSIKKQSGYDFFYNGHDMQKAHPVTLNLRNVSIEEALKACFEGQELSYTIDEKTVVIKEKTLSFMNKVAQIFQSIEVKGRVVGDKGSPLPGASIKVKGTDVTTISNSDGEFSLSRVDEKAVLVISFIGYESKELNAAKDLGNIVMDLTTGRLEEIAIVSTGYEFVPKERATGSFTLIDNKTFNRSVSPDIISRLNSVTNGLLYQQEGLGTTLSVRGRSTLFSNAKPLIVIDNFPFDGDISTINPNDIENVTILKDAAAAAIWGTRAGNGVIVFTTKSGKYNQPTSITINSNITVGGKPDLYYEKQLTSSEVIDVEKFLFNQGVYTGTINTNYMVISPVVDILQKQKLGTLTTSQANAAIDVLRGLNIRDQLNQYYYRQSVNQQYNLNISGGSKINKYFLSGGYDRNSSSNVGQSNDRFTFKGNNQFKLMKEKLIISTDFTFNSSSRDIKGSAYNKFLPYEQIADESGSALPVLIRGGLRASFTDDVGGGLLLDWKYRPLDELRNGYASRLEKNLGFRVNLGAEYKVFEPLSVSLNYQYYGASTLGESPRTIESFEARNLINSASYIDQTTGLLVRPIPYGGILGKDNSTFNAKAARGQLNFNKLLADHEITAIAGYEVRQDKTANYETTLYGYNPDRASSSPVDQTAEFPNYFIPGASSVNPNTQGWAVDNSVSYYFNASYAFRTKYVLSGSYRKDESNLFGVKANQKGVPLWSGGLLWNLHKEAFFKLPWVDKLALRATLGYNGNVNKNITAYLTAQSLNTVNLYQQNYSTIINAPNENLRWERVRNVNLGIDFSVFQGRLSGSVELFDKRGFDLIGSNPIAPQVGQVLYTGNVASTKTRGIDVQINSVNVNQKFKWLTTLIFNTAKDEVTNYQDYTGNNESIISANGINPIVGFPINSMFAYRWGGLDQNGNPKGFLNGVSSVDYTSIRQSFNIKDLDFYGSKIPTIYGSVRNTFSYKFVELSFTIGYKYGYYIRKSALNYTSLYAGAFNQPDFERRWQNPGDELKTDVPKMIYPSNNSSDSYYNGASVHIEKGDQIRFQDIQLNFNLNRQLIRSLPLSNLSIYAYATNLGLIWKSSKTFADPDVRYGSPYPFSCSFGLKTIF